MTTTTLEPRGDTRAPGPSDCELLDRVRAGDSAAYGVLYERHEPSAKSLARYLTKSGHDADDVVADAFARVLRAIKGGAGPTEAFRPYLLTAVRRTVWRKSEDARHHRLAADEDEEEMFDLRLQVEPEDRTEESIILRAFAELPERWQLVLWHTEIEGQPPAAVAPLLGLSPNATAALAVRAREGLRQAYLQAHLQNRPAEGCRFTVEHLGAYIRDGLGRRDTAKVEEHLGDCESCDGLRDDLGSLNKVLRSVVGPAVLGTGAARYLADAGGKAGAASTAANVRDIAHRVRFPQAVGVAGAAALLLITLGVRSDVARSPEQSLPVSEVVDEVALTPAGTQLVGSALAGSGGGSPTVSSEPCDGARLPLSLPPGATPTGAALVQGGPTVDGPTVVGPEAGNDFEAVDDGSTTLVSDGAACLSSQVIAALAGAPDDTALAVSFIDQLGNLQILIVPKIVDVVTDALQAATELVASTPLAQYLDALADALGQLPGDLSSLPGTGGTGTDTGDLSDVLDPSVDVPDLPAIPPPTGGDDGGGDDVLPTIPSLPLPTIPTLPTLPGLP
jgi:RNA polymerase sigma factor (sigma-70 family)